MVPRVGHHREDGQDDRHQAVGIKRVARELHHVRLCGQGRVQLAQNFALQAKALLQQNRAVLASWWRDKRRHVTRVACPTTQLLTGCRLKVSDYKSKFACVVRGSTSAVVHPLTPLKNAESIFETLKVPSRNKSPILHRNLNTTSARRPHHRC